MHIYCFLCYCHTSGAIASRADTLKMKSKYSTLGAPQSARIFLFFNYCSFTYIIQKKNLNTCVKVREQKKYHYHHCHCSNITYLRLSRNGKKKV